MAGGCGVGAFCSFCGKCGRVFGSMFSTDDVPDVLPPGVSSSERDAVSASQGNPPECDAFGCVVDEDDLAKASKG